jgi:hypothetical protein
MTGMAKAADRWHRWLLGEVLDRVLSPREIAEFTAHVKPLVESGTGRERQALAYLAAAKN